MEPGASLRVADNAVLDARSVTLPFSREEGVNDEWTMEGGTMRSISIDSSYSFMLPYTNATKTVSGSGTLYLYQFNFNSGSNAVLRLNGPDAYLRDAYVSSSRNIGFEIGGGSTLGVWGADLDINRWQNKIIGNAAIDTTNFL